jgi:hypothetical protein
MTSMKPNAKESLRTIAIVVVFCFVAAEDSHLKKRWMEVTSRHGIWGVGMEHQRRAQVCDPWVSKQDLIVHPDNEQGCAVVFISDPTDNFTVGMLPANQQNNFQNTWHYESAWTLHRKGFKADSLPRAPQDMDPVCYVANVNGTIVLGYEEGNGNSLLPCPGGRRAYPFTESEIMNADEAQLEDMCSMCYQSVCTGNGKTDPQSCGYWKGDGKEIEGDDDETRATLIKQATPAYHCHLTMADDGACDYVQYEQHEYSRKYYMNYSVLCGWKAIKEMNLTFCDCTAQRGTPNNCQRQHCLSMAMEGIVCGNCGGCSQTRAKEAIFLPRYEDGRDSETDPYRGVCADVRLATTEAERYQAEINCSASLNCRRTDSLTKYSGCIFHCDKYNDTATCSSDRRDMEEAGVEPREEATGSARKLSFFGLDGAKKPQSIALDQAFSSGNLVDGFAPIRATSFKRTKTASGTAAKPDVQIDAKVDTK